MRDREVLGIGKGLLEFVRKRSLRPCCQAPERSHRPFSGRIGLSVTAQEVHVDGKSTADVAHDVVMPYRRINPVAEDDRLVSLDVVLVPTRKLALKRSPLTSQFRSCIGELLPLKR